MAAESNSSTAKQKKTSGKKRGPSLRSKTQPAKPVRARPVSRNEEGTRALRRTQAKNRIRATMTGTRVFDRSLHKTNSWLKEVMKGMKWDNRERSLSALRATLHALRDTMFLEEVVQLGAELPIILRGVYYEGWNPHQKQIRLKSVEDFHGLVLLHLGPGRQKFGKEDIRQFSRVCLEVLTNRVSRGEMKEVQGLLPRKLASLIPLESEGTASLSEVA
jgi:uncharacterized protein (DUF2267 family)